MSAAIHAWQQRQAKKEAAASQRRQVAWAALKAVRTAARDARLRELARELDADPVSDRAPLLELLSEQLHAAAE